MLDRWRTNEMQRVRSSWWVVHHTLDDVGDREAGDVHGAPILSEWKNLFGGYM